MFLAAAFDFCSLVEVKNQLACPCGILRLFLTSPRCIMKKKNPVSGWLTGLEKHFSI